MLIGEEIELALELSIHAFNQLVTIAAVSGNNNNI